jgi:hypothetical protein
MDAFGFPCSKGRVTQDWTAMTYSA